ncbi:thioredoxin domain-containing protein [Geofilum rubicundum]|uniref:Thioredoxin n=1 Tax=Geofilum rubicundum JCM 15548 TaxID=1236989 RepID=A0A0E9M324_9BACT|nr:thioredoxin domain-containing protein [Geofilum rubicundum]GAO31806.1 thioredoxin [Geofilum rubicundum JCM 15548]
MKHLFFTLLAALLMGQSTGCTAENRAGVKAENLATAPAETVETSQVIALDEASFAEVVFDFKNSSEWDYKGDRPAIIDFYATWCGPCKRLAPVLVELQSEYGDKIQIYKVDAEKNRELAAAFGVTAYPTMLFIPMDEDPAGAKGLLPKEELERIIETFLKVTK